MSVIFIRWGVPLLGFCQLYVLVFLFFGDFCRDITIQDKHGRLKPGLDLRPDKFNFLLLSSKYPLSCQAPGMHIVQRFSSRFAVFVNKGGVKGLRHKNLDPFIKCWFTLDSSVVFLLVLFRCRGYLTFSCPSCHLTMMDHVLQIVRDPIVLCACLDCFLLIQCFRNLQLFTRFWERETLL